MRNILKIGFLDLPENRWLDALSTFEYVHNIVMYETELNKLNHDRIISFSLLSANDSFFVRKFNNMLISQLLKHKKINRFLFLRLVFVFQLINKNKILNYFKTIEFEECHSSYNDYDNSDLLTIILKPFIKTRIIRSQKETRPEYSTKERECFAIADTVIFNSEHNLKFFEQKYGVNTFRNKTVLLDLDEDWRKKSVWKFPENFKKLSSIDTKLHIVILTGVARSTPSNKRTGARQYYVELINKLLLLGLEVHLHARFFEPDEHGINIYQEIAKKNQNFKIHPTLDFVNDTENAYNQLAKYDFGILHNFIEGESVSYFDKYNIPHRFFEYQIANVIPVVIKGDTIVVEQLINTKKCGLVLDDYSQLPYTKGRDNISFLELDFSQFIKAVYN